jgi:diguanylate cyclase (GGDEF)-like protein/PAS domain S-box-containing protein
MDEHAWVRELRRSEQRLRTVLDSAADLVVLVGANGELLYTSERASLALGYETGADALPIADYVHPDDIDDVATTLATALATPGPLAPFSCRVLHADGTWRDMEGTGVNLLDDPDVEALVVGLRDMTERRSVERNVLRLHRLNTVLAEVNEAVLRATDPVNLLEDACRIAVQLGGIGVAWIGMRESDRYVPRAQFGADLDQIARLRTDYDAPSHEDSPAMEAARTRRPVVVDDVAAGPPLGGWREVSVALGLQSSLHLPLVVDGDVVGVVNVYGEAVGFFDDAAIGLLERLADNLAYGLATLEHARRRAAADAALSRRTRQQQSVAQLGALALAAVHADDVADAVARAVSACLDADMSSVLRVLPSGDAIEICAGTGWERGVVGTTLPRDEMRPVAWVVDHREPLVVEELAEETRFPPAEGLLAAGVAAGITVPVEVDGRVWGALAVHSRTSRSFDLDDVSYVQSAANVLAAAVGRHEAFSRLRHQALHDPLTGLPNRILFEDRAGQALERQRRGEATAAVAVLDVDGFQLVNDTLGSTGGDDLLRAVGQRLSQVVERGDTVARLAADEFAILREHAGSADLADLIRSALAEPVEVAGRPLTVTVTIGTAEADEPGGLSGTDLLHRALAALHLAKSDGRGRHRRHDADLEAELTSRFDLQADLATALDADQLALWYQPIVDTTTGAVVAAEALLRWHHPTRGLVPPCEFIPLAEDTGLIVPIGAWVIDEACRATGPWARWARSTGRPFHVSVNLSAVQLTDPSLVEHVEASLDRYAVPRGALRLEITESVLFSERDASTSVLQRLHDLGVGLVVDDFGTGYSSLSYLQRFPLRGLKIDRTFTSTLSSPGDQSAAIVEAIVGMAGALGLETVAEGVEDEEQRARLQRLGCPYSQGWLFGRPVVADDYERVLRASAPAPDRSRDAARSAIVRAVAHDADPDDRLADSAFRAVVDSTRDIVSTFDRDLRHIYVNAAAERITGISRSTFIGRTNLELGMPPRLVQKWDSALRSVFLTGRPVDLEYSFDGPVGRRWFTARLVPEIVEGTVATVSAITQDVTDRRLASAVTPTAIDPVTRLLARRPFDRLVSGLRHGDSGRFGLVRVAFGDTTIAPDVGPAVRGCLLAGDVAARWSTDELVVLRHPLGSPVDVDDLAARIGTALRPFGAAVVQAWCSADEGDSPATLLARAATPAPGASGSAAHDAAAGRPASPASV